MTLYRIADKLEDTVGEKIMKRALKMPLRKIIENGGKDYTEIMCHLAVDEAMREIAKESNQRGYDAKNDRFVEMHKAGIIDPVKVERCAIENATSLASTFLTVHGSVSLIRELPVKGE